MLTDSLKRKIAAYMLSPRLREAYRKDKDGKVYCEEDQSIEALFRKYPSVSDLAAIKESYHWYLTNFVDAINACDPENPRIDKTANHNTKITTIRNLLQAGSGDLAKNKAFKEFSDDLTRRDLTVIESEMAEIAREKGGGPNAATSMMEAEKPFQPVGIIPYDPKALDIASSTINQATSGRFRSGSAMIEHIHNCEKEVERLRRAGPAIQQADKDDDYVAVRKPARDVFRGAFLTDIKPNDLNFEITVLQWRTPHSKVPEINPNYTFPPDDLYELLWAIERGRNTVLVGPPGCGKTVATEQLAARLGRPYFRVPVDGEMRKREILGGFKQVTEGSHTVTKWFDGMLVQAIQLPSLLDMDEIDRGDPDLQYVAHQVYEGKGITILEDEGRFIKPHPMFSLIGTSNTKGRAEGMNIYNLSAEMSEATRDRFPLWVRWNYMPEDVEKKQLKRDVPSLSDTSVSKIIQVANGLRAALIEGKMRTVASYRQVYNCGDYTDFLKKSFKDENYALSRSLYKIFVERATDEGEVSAMLEIIKKSVGVPWENYLKEISPNKNNT